jgi:hypothetical protein
MVVLAQLVRASVCGTEGRGFEPHIPPNCFESSLKGLLFCVKVILYTPDRYRIKIIGDV